MTSPLELEAERLRQAVEAAGLGLWEYDLDSGELTWSDRTRALYGHPPGAPVTYEGYVAQLHPEEREVSVARVRAALEDPQAQGFEVEHRAVWPDGTIRWLLGHGRVVRDATGRPRRLTGTSWDITDRKLAELAKSESEQRLDLAVRAHGIGIFDWNVKTGGLVWTEQEQRLFGLEPGQFEGGIEGWASRVHPEDLPSVQQRLQDAMAAGAQTVDFDFRVLLPGGETRHIEGSGRILYDADGAPERMIGVNMDVTERRRAEYALRESEARLRSVGENIPFAMIYQIAVPADGSARRFLYVSGSCEQLNGIRPEEAMADPMALYALVAPEERERLGALEAEALAARTAFDTEVRFHLRDGRSRWFRLASAPRETKGGETIWDGIQIDVTERREAEERRRLLTDELNHRVKNTLAIVQSIAFQTFREGVATEDARRRFQGRVAALAQAHDLLTRESWTSVPLGEVIDLALSGLTPGPERLEIAGDQRRLDPQTAVSLAMVMHELGTNASKHGAWSAADGRVRVSWRAGGSAEDPRLLLRWEEVGGPPVRPPERRGFGTRLIERGVAADLGATIDYAPEGLVCLVTARLRPA